MAKKISETDEKRIMQLLEDGHNQDKIAKFYGISQSNVSRIKRKIRKIKLTKLDGYDEKKIKDFLYNNV